MPAVMGSLSAYSSAVKSPMLVLKVAMGFAMAAAARLLRDTLNA